MFFLACFCLRAVRQGEEGGKEDGWVFGGAREREVGEGWGGRRDEG